MKNEKTKEAQQFSPEFIETAKKMFSEIVASKGEEFSDEEFNQFMTWLSKTDLVKNGEELDSEAIDKRLSGMFGMEKGKLNKDGSTILEPHEGLFMIVPADKPHSGCGQIQLPKGFSVMDMNQTDVTDILTVAKNVLEQILEACPCPHCDYFLHNAMVNLDQAGMWLNQFERPLTLDAIASDFKNSETETEKADYSTLVGSDIVPTTFDAGVMKCSAGSIVRKTFAESGMNIEEWNALSTEDRDKLLQAELDSLQLIKSQFDLAQERKNAKETAETPQPEVMQETETVSASE